MIIAIAVGCALFGFVAAILVSRPANIGKGGFWLPELLRVILRDGRGELDFADNETDLHPTPRRASGSGSSGLLSMEQVEERFEASSWQALAYQDFRSKILAKETGMKTFPCVYATMGYREKGHRYIFLHSDNPAEPRNVRTIAPALEEYLTISPALGSNTSLVIFGAPSDTSKSVEDYNSTFWQMLRGLRIADPNPWPEDVPETLDSEKWTFCYGGTAVFPVMLTPAHSHRWSRHMSVPVIALQPKWVLDQLLSTPDRRASATGKVRKLLKEYDQIEISPDLTSYGQAGTSEARQLCLLDENETAKQPYINLDV